MGENGHCRRVLGFVVSNYGYVSCELGKSIRSCGPYCLLRAALLQVGTLDVRVYGPSIYIYPADVTFGSGVHFLDG